MRAGPAPVALVALGLLLTGCIATEPEPPIEESTTPIGPVAPAPLSLQDVAGIVGEDDATPTSIFSPDGEIMTSGDVLASENDYWLGVGGTPQECAPVVSAPYLVSAADTGTRLDDDAAVLGTITELDEERFGLIQIFARQFDDTATAQAFLGELAAAVADCPGYRLVDGTTVTYDARDLELAEIPNLPESVSGVRYSETAHDSASLGTTTAFLQREGIVISVYGEVTPSSTISVADADALTATIASRLAAL
ncbi:MAG: hypothetical protein R2717_07405 [Schumannella sp.]|nr:hypothetical protein [Microbacteriaceae bacterium]